MTALVNLVVFIAIVSIQPLNGLPSVENLKHLFSSLGFWPACVEESLRRCQSGALEHSQNSPIQDSINELKNLQMSNHEERVDDLKMVAKRLESLEELISNGTFANLDNKAPKHRESSIACDYPYERVAGSCLHVQPADQPLGWADARAFCKRIRRGSDLAIVKDVTNFEALLNFLKANSGMNVWIGATDEDEEGVWKWLDGSLVPMGSPYWGIYKSELQPDGGAEENCGFMWADVQFYIYDLNCTFPSAIPLCQYFPA